jgi:accessory gene regulator protein AgrB
VDAGVETLYGEIVECVSGMLGFIFIRDIDRYDAFGHHAREKLTTSLST